MCETLFSWCLKHFLVSETFFWCLKVFFLCLTVSESLSSAVQDASCFRSVWSFLFSLCQCVVPQGMEHSSGTRWLVIRPSAEVGRADSLLPMKTFVQAVGKNVHSAHHNVLFKLPQRQEPMDPDAMLAHAKAGDERSCEWRRRVREDVQVPSVGGSTLFGAFWLSSTWSSSARIGPSRASQWSWRTACG